MAKPASPPTAQRSDWLVSPRHDLLFYSGLSFVSAVVVLALGRVVDPLKLFVWFNLVLTVGHYAPTWMRALLDREEFKTHRTSIILFPLVFLAMVWVTRAQPEVLALVIYLWDRFHAVMQNYGFLRLYDARAGNSEASAGGPRRTGRTEQLLLFSSALALMSFNMGLLAPFLNLLVSASLPLSVTPTLVWGLRAVTCGFALFALVRYVLEQLRARREGTFSTGKQAFVVLLFAGHALMNATTNVFLLSAHEKLYHSVQYVVLVWHYNRRRAATRAAELTAPMRVVFGARHPLFYLLAIALFVVVVAGLFEWGGFSLGSGGEGFAFTRLGSAVALTHYYFDSFLWRVRREQVRVNL